MHEILRLPITQSVGCGSGIMKHCFKTIFTTTATQEMSSFCQIAIAVCTTVVHSEGSGIRTQDLFLEL